MIAAIYARKSTDQTAVSEKEKSVARQVEHAREYAAKNGWTVSEDNVFIDDGISGAEFSTRPGFLRLMNALKPRPPFQVLIMSEESRLGREQIEVSYAMKQLVTSGVRVFCYLTGTERTLDSPIEKAMLALQSMADEMERERARVRTYDAMVRKAKAGHVTGGRVFGYNNVDVMGVASDGQVHRSHVERQIKEEEAAVIRRIFRMRAEGSGLTTIAKTLNADGAPTPRAQQGRPKGWGSSSVREVLNRRLYCGEIVWNRTKKRNAWGQVGQKPRPDSDWIRIPAPQLRIVSDELWNQAHERIEDARSRYLRTRDGRVLGRPPATGAKYLLTGLLSCECGSGFEALSRPHGRRRAFVYGCAAHRRKGKHVCANDLVVSMEVADAAVLGAIERDLLRPDVFDAAVERAAAEYSADGTNARIMAIQAERTGIEAEMRRLSDAIAAAGELGPLVETLRERDRRLKAIDLELRALPLRRPIVAGEALRRAARERLNDWRRLLQNHPQQAQQVLRRLIVGRLMFRPTRQGNERFYAFSGVGTLARVLSGLVLSFLRHR